MSGGSPESRAAVEALMAATEALAGKAKAKRWPAETVADGLFRAAVAVHLSEFGLAPTAVALARLADELGRLASVIDGAR